ncbi:MULTISPECIES: PH domain-containing protein [Psychrilyobacter]|uniref:Bacterial Pleckstrin homology domain-containing protein n=1 Tax=Psychrilyobacter piezotolerans TaxID=2293438 RepID=A0ABX9KIP6_9FUSO|nr:MULTISPECIES: PH domain-containing protein [Psychrilyobacter]MCS5420753.1 PH domain-containing protein [Psychrilyobacter sp. S5]NDI77453.1 hypothetical protein [Psychrilyobacter piezotolerans]RDE63755.1 hypothetical protein DV867_05100 [Psychrilyobacter sp. S5]REI42099.1 hypothetical protein DYH56_05100 [Psychrilyobacter piezotolerans]
MAFFGKPKTEEEKNKKEEKKLYEEVGKYLLDGETIEKTFGIIDKAYLTNKRVIFKDKNLSFSDKTLEEMVFIPIKNIDSISIVKTSGIIAPHSVVIKCKGSSNSMRFGKEDSTVIDFVKAISRVTV